MGKNSTRADEHEPLEHHDNGVDYERNPGDEIDKTPILRGDLSADLDNLASLGVDTPLQANLDEGAGGVYRDKPIFDEAGIINQIATGRSIDNPNGVITYTFADTPQLVGLFNNPNYDFGAPEGYRPFSPDQENAAREAIQLWDDLIPQSFRESNGMGADIVFANSADPAQAYAYLPIPPRGWQFQSDVFIADPELNGTNALLDWGGYGQSTLVHEIGHAVGLSHPGAYNGAGATNYVGQAEYAQDSLQYSIMSYWSAGETGAVIFDFNNTGGTFALAGQAPLLHDILAIQAQYGADMTTRTGDTTYGFGSTAERGIFDFAENSIPHYAIYDAGGEDTIDASGFGISQYINLNDGEFSSIGQQGKTYQAMAQDILDTYALFGIDLSYLGLDYLALVAQSWVTGARIDSEAAIAAETGYSGIYAIAHDNVAIAYDTMIENAVGGQARDLLVGNELDNLLDGQGGDDVIIGGLGNDTLTGGTGGDQFVFEDLEMGDLITDFDGSEGDMIDLSAFADDLGTDLSFIADAAFSGTAGEVRYEGGVLSMDANGDMAADFAVTIGNGADVDASMLALAAGA